MSGSFGNTTKNADTFVPVLVTTVTIIILTSYPCSIICYSKRNVYTTLYTTHKLCYTSRKPYTYYQANNTRAYRSRCYARMETHRRIFVLLKSDFSVILRSDRITYLWCFSTVLGEFKWKYFFIGILHRWLKEVRFHGPPNSKW